MEMMEQEPDILSMLLGLFQPAEADAAQRNPRAEQLRERELALREQRLIPDPVKEMYRQLQQTNQSRRLDQSDAAGKVREREVALREQKQQPQDIQGQLQKILGGGSNSSTQYQDYGVPELDIRDRNPTTGTPYFSNYKAADYASPERKAEVDQQYQARQGKIAAVKQSRASASSHDPAKVAEVAARLKAMDVPDSAITLTIENMFPGYGAKAPAKKPIALDKLANLYNKKTGAPATEEFIDSEPDEEILKRDYISLVPKDKERLSNLQQLENTITQYERMGGPGGALKLSPKPGFMSTQTDKLAMKYNRASGGVEAADQDSINAQITSLARAFGGDSRVSDKEMELLRSAVITDGDNQAAVAVKMTNLKQFRDSIAKIIPIPGIQKKYSEGGSSAGSAKPKLASQAQLNAAVHAAGGNKQKALEALRAQGFTGAQ